MPRNQAGEGRECFSGRTRRFAPESGREMTPNVRTLTGKYANKNTPPDAAQEEDEEAPEEDKEEEEVSAFRFGCI